MSDLPPMGGVAPPLQCNRVLQWPDESTKCGREATWHIIWNADVDNGLTCDEHHAEVLRQWKPLATHPYRMECSMPGAVYRFAENVCVVDEGPFEFETVELAAAVATRSEP